MILLKAIPVPEFEITQTAASMDLSILGQSSRARGGILASLHSREKTLTEIKLYISFNPNRQGRRSE